MGTNRVSAPTLPTGAEVAVFVSGVTSMGLEILAGRMVAPQFGSSIYTWGSIIGVFLAALSLGYYQGGKQAADHASHRRLVTFFLGTAFYVAVLILAGDTLLRWTATFPLPSRFASLPAVTLLFGPPTYLLGFVSPYGAELSAMDDTGEASGHVYALGTVGSIVGAFATTYVLVPALSIDQIALAFGLLSAVTAVAVARPSPDGRQIAASVFVALLLLAAAAAGSTGVAVDGQVVYETQTPYQQLRVVDRGDTRTLYLDGQPHSATDLDDPSRHVFDYTSYFHLPRLMTDDIDRVLFVGGGGFTGPKHFARMEGVTVDVAEIDPEVVDTAKRYFGVEESPELNIYTQGGRQFLRETNETYDLIVLDAYKKDKVPFQLTTVEFMRLAEDRLAADGVLYANLISAPTGPASDFYRAEYKTVAQVFPRVYSFPTSRADAVQNIEIIATKREARITQAELRARNARRAGVIDLEDEIATYRTDVKTSDVPILRDGHAPVDSLMDSMAGRKYVLDQTDDREAGTGANATATATAASEGRSGAVAAG